MIELSEVILLISEHLNYEDLQNLRITCKKLKEITDQRPFRSLHLLRDYPCERTLFHTGELVNYANTFRVPEPGIWKSPKFKSQFTELRKLSIYHREKPNLLTKPELVDPNDLNCFQDLVHLEVVGPAFGSGELSLRNLEILFLGNLHLDAPIFTLHCSQLKALGLRSIANPRLTPETSKSLRHFALEMRWNGEWLPLYGEFKNLSTIAFTGAQDVTTFVLAVIERRLCLPSLKQIQLKEMRDFSDLMLRNLIELKSRYERQVEILINWKAMTSDELTELLHLLPSICLGKSAFFHNSQQFFFFGRPDGNLLRHFTEKPILHCLLPGIFDLILRSNEDVTSAKRLISKLDKLIGLTIGKDLELDEQFFECILKTCRGIRFLRIESALIKQKQLDQMPKYLQNLNRLELEEDLSQSNFNLNFVTKFKNLSRIIFGFNIPKETTSFLLQNCTSGPNFHLQLHGKQSIFIFGQPRFEILRGSLSTRTYLNPSTKKTKFANIDDLFEHYYGQDLFNTPWEENIAPARQMNTNFRCSLI